jgi:hypothetical protein
MRARNTLFAAAAIVLVGAGYAAAQDAATYDPGQLPAIHGKVAEYSLTPRGDVDGLILADGTEVHLPPYLGTQLVFAIKPGDSVTVRGLKARALPMVQAMSVTNDASGAAVTDSGPREMRGPLAGDQAMTAQGTIKVLLHGPRGEANGVLLTDGTIVRLPPPEMRRMEAKLVPGATVYASGDGYAGPLGHVVAARQIGPDKTQLTQVELPPPGPHGHHPRPPGGPAGGPTPGTTPPA